jgi:hypothetical protein
MYQRNISPLSSGSKTKKQGKAEQSLFGLLFIPDDGDGMSL